MFEIVFVGLVGVAYREVSPFCEEAFLVGLVLGRLAYTAGNAFLGDATVVVV